MQHTIVHVMQLLALESDILDALSPKLSACVAPCGWRYDRNLH